MIEKNNYQNPLVSIIMPTFNRAKYLEDSISKILLQTYKNIELIIIDDCSVDETQIVLSNLKIIDSRIKIIQTGKNIGLIKSLNLALGLAKGKYIARADDDDAWINKNKLKEQINFLEENTEYVIIGTGTIVINEKKEEIFRYRQPNSDKSIRAKMLFGNPFIHSTVVFRKSILEKTGLYDENLSDAEDWDLWMRMGMYGKLYNFPTYDTYRFYGERGLSIKNRKNISKTRLQLIKKYKNKYPHFIPSYLFNSLQRLYTCLPYIKKLDNFLFKTKRRVLMR